MNALAPSSIAMRAGGIVSQTRLSRPGATVLGARFNKLTSTVVSVAAPMEMPTTEDSQPRFEVRGLDLTHECATLQAPIEPRIAFKKLYRIVLTHFLSAYLRTCRVAKSWPTCLHSLLLTFVLLFPRNALRRILPGHSLTLSRMLPLSLPLPLLPSPLTTPLSGLFTGLLRAPCSGLFSLLATTVVTRASVTTRL